jgi:prolyl oligopeptidase
VAEALVQTGVTTSDRLGIRGGSNGGLLMGVAYTQRPDLYKAVLCLVPLLDMLRYDKLPPGASWVAEYGDPDNESDRESLMAFSPYQNLSSDTDYPKVFFITSTKDDRVHPGHARKMAALMAKQGHPFYYFENTEGGHGAATNQKQRARQLALEVTYLLRMLQTNAETSESEAAK